MIKKKLKGLSVMGLVGTLMFSPVSSPSTWGTEANNPVPINVNEKYEKLKKAGILNGYEDGKAHLEKNITRAQLTVILARLLDIKPLQVKKSTFADAQNHWAKPYIEAMYTKKIMIGVGKGKFFPEQPVTFEQFATVIMRSLGSPIEKAEKLEGTSTWAKDYVHTAIKMGIMEKKSDYHSQVIRYDMVDVIYKTQEIRVGKENHTSPTTTNPTTTNPTTTNPTTTNPTTTNPTTTNPTTTNPTTTNPTTTNPTTTNPTTTNPTTTNPTTTNPTPNDPTPNDSTPTEPIPSPEIYSLELERWGIYNDGTHPVETTKGFNDALQWASENGKTTFKVPAGHYMIKKDNPPNSFTRDTTARINMVPNMTFLMDDNAILEKETSANEGYALMYLGPYAHHVTLKGGVYKGDKDTHDYSNGGTHESGVGIFSEGTKKLTIDGVKSYNFTGDGLVLGAYGKQVNVLYESDFESGSVDDNGNLTEDPTKIRTKNIKTNFSNTLFRTLDTFNFTNPINVSKKTPYHLYFYKEDGTFISSIKNQEFDWSYIDIPLGASYFTMVLDTSVSTGIRIEYWLRELTEDATIQNSELSFNRRQGITASGANNITIYNNEIHDIQGTAPESGIDLEGGIGGNGSLNANIYIKNNRFYNNNAYNVILYDGYNATVEGNYLGPNATKSSIGVAVSIPFRSGALIKNNIFDGTKIASENESVIEGNEMNDSVVSLTGSNITLDGMIFRDSQLILNTDKPFGVTVSNITMYNNNKSSSGLTVNNNPIHFTNVSLLGKSTSSILKGNAMDGSVFDNLKVIGYVSAAIPRGTYNNCQFEQDSSGTSPLAMSTAGTYGFNQCTFKTYGTTMVVNHPDADLTIKDSTFDMLGATETVYIQAAKKVLIENNTMNAKYMTTLWRGVIKLNQYGQAANPSDVLEGTIRGNTITTANAAKGISTIDANAGSSPFLIENNILYNAKLELKGSDLSVNNQELAAATP